MKWYYAVEERFVEEPLAQLRAFFNEMQVAGWELVSIQQGPAGWKKDRDGEGAYATTRYFFKRPAEEPKVEVRVTQDFQDLDPERIAKLFQESTQRVWERGGPGRLRT